MSSSEEALKVLGNDVTLGFCENCGFISNITYNSSVMNYSSIYEDQQCFSPTFNDFTSNLATYLVKKYNLNNKKILEIGCGKGDFLALLCELGNNIGVGIDPAYVKNRIQTTIEDQLVFIQDYYSEKYAQYHGDLIICRHTLEHIPQTASFLSKIRNAIGNRLDTTIFFEVPDVTRILCEVAFWDIYYEHCSYFSPASLANLFRLCHFEILELTRAFNNQYLLIEARPIRNLFFKAHRIEETLEELAQRVAFFSTRSSQKQEYWKNALQQWHNDQKRIVIWGSGSKCVSLITTLKIKDEIDHIIDINPHRQGKYLAGIGKQIKSPDFLKNYTPDITLVMNPNYCQEIQNMLNNLNVSTQIIPLK
jgi:SAM-dependent methyltransferase